MLRHHPQMRHVTLKTADIHTNSQGEQGGLGASSPSWDTVKAEVSLIMVLLLVLQGCWRKSLLLEGHSVLRRWMLLLRGAASASWITALPLERLSWKALLFLWGLRQDCGRRLSYSYLCAFRLEAGETGQLSWFLERLTRACVVDQEPVQS